VPSFFSIVSGAANTDWASGLLGGSSPGEDIDGFKSPVMAKDGAEENSQESTFHLNWSWGTWPSWSMNIGHPVQSEFRIHLHYTS